MIDIIGKKWLYFLISGLIIIPGLISLILWGVKPGIDFTGGTLVELKFSQPTKKVSNDTLKKSFDTQKVDVATIQESGTDTYLVRLKPLSNDQHKTLQTDLKKEYGNVEELRYETVGPTVGKETTENAAKGVLVASLAIVFYIAWAFRHIPKPYSSVHFGIAAIIALLHDILVVVGLFSLFGHFYHVEIDSLFITALLTVMGFSVHDTIVVFDRIRENLRKHVGASFAEVVNESMVQTLARSFSTSLTVIFTLFALVLFGGESIKWFVVALLIGVASGTYSSIFNAAPLLVAWEEWSKKRKARKNS